MQVLPLQFFAPFNLFNPLHGSTPGETELKDLETAISEKTKDVTLLREETRNIDNQLGSLNSSLTTAQARERVGEMDSPA